MFSGHQSAISLIVSIGEDFTPRPQTQLSAGINQATSGKTEQPGFRGKGANCFHHRQGDLMIDGGQIV